MTEFQIEGLHCGVCRNPSGRICYIISPMAFESALIDGLSAKYGCSLVVVTGMDWDNDLTPWPAPGQPSGCPPFEGKGASFMKLFNGSVIPEIERRIDVGVRTVSRTLVGVSLSGLFTLWDWLQCDLFENMASISGSFWYSGFVTWLENLRIPEKSGKVYMSLGDRETHTPVKAFQSVADDTAKVCHILSGAGINVVFESTKGTHYAPLYPRLLKAFEFLYGKHDL